LGVIVVGRSEARSVARCRTTLLFLSTLKSARNFAFASWISCSWRSSNRSCSSVGKVSQVGVMILLVETSDLSFEPAIEGRFDRSICVVPSGVAKKYVDAFLERQTLNKNRGGALCTGADGPRAGAGRSAAWCEARRCSLHRGGWSAQGPDGPRPGARLGLLPDSRTIRALGPDGQRVRRGGGRSPAVPGSRSREGPRRGGEILGVV
jgi:hypothetical protein